MSENDSSQNNSTKEGKASPSDLLNRLYANNTSDKIPIGVLLKTIDSGGFALIMLLLSLIMLVPTPPPISQICSILLLFFSFQMIIGLQEVWLPKFITNKTIDRKVLAFVVGKTSSILYKLERFTRRRLMFMSSLIAERITGVLIFVLSIITLVPIPFINMIPGFAIVLISFGMLNKDGLIIIIGFIIGAMGVSIAWSMIALGKTMVIKLIHRYFGD